MTSALRLTEIFCSLQGEARSMGRPSVFVRLTGCPLRCVYCDTAYAFTGGVIYQLDEVLREVASHGAALVCVTGGEPLAQPACVPLLAALCDAGYEVSLETSGALDISAVDPRVSRVMDLKTPGSGEQERNLLDNIAHLRAHDQVKFVICDEADYQWALTMLRDYQLEQRVGEVLFSPSHATMDARTLAEWILRDRLPVRFQLQLHKLLWDDAAGR
ncbi:MAG TPA: 7-carboxy-7-deazaguanine synthase QueE [Pseudomonadaceae bacterium]|nr:7-carboxy-7-deazaguanine synthase QueE [Pseudomonadaceae bacterium]